MPYDEDLADRIRELMCDHEDLTESKMFGGLAFSLAGHLAIAASGQGGVLVRVDPVATERLVATSAATPAIMRGREMAGWVRVGPDDLRTKRQLSRWVRLGTERVRSLPPKRRS